MVERHLLWMTRHLFHLYGSEVFSATEDKRTDSITDAPIAHSSENSKGLGSCEPETVDKDQIYI